MKNKFENIAVGDTVYISVDLRYGFAQPLSFWLPRKVQRLTKTLFILTGRKGVEAKYKKADGSKPSHTYGTNAYALSDVVGDKAVTDQSVQYQDTKDRMDYLWAAHNLTNQLKFTYREDLDTLKLLLLVKQIETLLNPTD